MPTRPRSVSPDEAVAHGFSAGIPDRLDVTVGYGRGERASPSLTHQTPPFLMINRTPTEGRDEWLDEAGRLA